MAGSKWQDLKLCDRCGKRATVIAKAPSDYDNREILLCAPHQEEHGEALKAQKFNVESLYQPDLTEV